MRNQTTKSPAERGVLQRFPEFMKGSGTKYLGSVFAAEGTEAHRLCEYLLHDMLGIPDTDPRPEMQGAPAIRYAVSCNGAVIHRIEDFAARKWEEIRKVTARDAILDYIIRLSEASRTHPAVEIGISPRGSLFLDRAAKARAWTEGRDYVTGPDVAAVFRDVCAHRLILKEESGETAERVLDELLKTLPRLMK